MSKKSLPKPKSKSNLDKLKNDDCQPTLTKEHPELDLKFVIDKKIRKGLKPLMKEDDAPELTQAFFDAAVLMDGNQLKKAGKPSAEVLKILLKELGGKNPKMTVIPRRRLPK
jgi:hypothetical protein